MQLRRMDVGLLGRFPCQRFPQPVLPSLELLLQMRSNLNLDVVVERLVERESVGTIWACDFLFHLVVVYDFFWILVGWVGGRRTAALTETLALLTL